MNTQMQDDQPESETELAARMAVLNRLGNTASRKIRELIAGRTASGIEIEWTGDEEFYQGYDDANRHEFVNMQSKPSISGGTSNPKAEEYAGSIVFPNITQPYVDAFAARTCDILMPGNERNFAAEPTTIPEMGGLPPAEPMPVPMAPPNPGMPPMQQGAQPPVDPQIQADKANKDLKAEATRKAKKAEDQIGDWLDECQYLAETRKMGDDWVKLGTGVLKGPDPVWCRSAVWQTNDQGVQELAMVEEIKPGSRRIDPWNLYPDWPTCGEDIHNGSCIAEKDQIATKKLEDLKGLPGYIDSQIDLCIAQGPTQDTAGNQHDRTAKELFTIWYWYGAVTKEELEAAGCECGEETTYPAILTIVNDMVIRAALNPLDTGDFPYDMVPLKRRPNMPWGMGLARQLRTPQRIIVGAAREMMNNLGAASGPMFVFRRGVQPEDGIWEVKPRKIFVEDDDAGSQSGPPVLAVTVPSFQAELSATMQIGMKMAEDVTGMPMLMQGQQGAAPDTVGGMTILNNNANAVLRRVARLFDACITEPHIRRYYRWLMVYGKDEDAKGDFQIVARGSTALVARDLQSQEMVNVLQLCLNPAYGKNPAKAMDEYLKSRRYTPAMFDYTEAELAQKAQQPPPEAPQVQVAKINAQKDLEKTKMSTSANLHVAEMDNQTAQERVRVDTDRDTVLVQAQTEKNRNDAELRMRELSMRMELAQLEYASKHSLKLEDVKAQMAKVAITANLQRDLAHIDGKNRQVMNPIAEPQGRAQPGHAFTQ